MDENGNELLNDIIFKRHAIAAQKALRYKEIEKLGERYKTKKGFKGVVPIIKPKTKFQKLKDLINKTIH